jgi:hypothetical protein
MDSKRWISKFAFFFSIFSSSAFRRSELTCLHSPLCGKCTSWHSRKHYRATWQRLNLVWEHAHVWPAPHQFRRSRLGNGCITFLTPFASTSLNKPLLHTPHTPEPACRAQECYKKNINSSKTQSQKMSWLAHPGSRSPCEEYK